MFTGYDWPVVAGADFSAAGRPARRFPPDKPAGTAIARLDRVSLPPCANPGSTGAEISAADWRAVLSPVPRGPAYGDVGVRMSIQLGVFVLVLVAAVGLFVKTHRGDSSVNSISNAAQSDRR